MYMEDIASYVVIRKLNQDIERSFLTSSVDERDLALHPTMYWDLLCTAVARPNFPFFKEWIKFAEASECHPSCCNRNE